MPIKYKYEVDFCEYITNLIIGALIDSSRSNYQTIAEAPKGLYSNNHVDMLIIDRVKERFLMIEYKLKDEKGLRIQIGSGKKIGILNRPLKNPHPLLFSWTGEDWETERISNHILESDRYARGHNWYSIHEHIFGMVYWWGFLNENNSLRGGTGIGESRPTFHHLYKEAVRNLISKYPNLTPMLTHKILDSGYTYSTAKKHIRGALKSERTDE